MTEFCRILRCQVVASSDSVQEYGRIVSDAEIPVCTPALGEYLLTNTWPCLACIIFWGLIAEVSLNKFERDSLENGRNILESEIYLYSTMYAANISRI